MVGKTEPLEIASYLEIMGVEQAGNSITVPIPEGKGHVRFTAFSRETKKWVEMKKGRPHLKVSIYVETEIDEKSNLLQHVDSTQVIKRIDKEIEERLEQVSLQLVKKTQKKGSDIFGFGERVRAKEPVYWNRHIRTNRKWRQVYRTLPVDIQVKHITRRTGMRER